MNREKHLDLILETIPADALVVTCNGKIGREIWELRKKREEPNNDFIMVGSMGLAFAISLGIALHTKKNVYCLVGDGNFLMKMGTLATYYKFFPRNLKIFVINNGVHDSTGGQETSFNDFKDKLPWNAYLRLIEVEPGARADLGRPTQTPVQIKEAFMKHANG